MQKIVLIAILGCAAAVPVFKVPTEQESILWDRFKSQFKKAYFDDSDESYRRSVFVANLRMIQTHNAEHAAGKQTYTMKMNEFGDMPFEEFHAKYTGFLGARHSFLRSQNVADLSSVVAADSVDWVAKGAVTPVKNQGQCGSCWAFSTTGSIEGANFIAGKGLHSLSEQELVDCSTSEGNMGCNGGLMDYGFEFVIKKGGICSESDYPYKAADGTCKSCSTVESISSYKDVSSNSKSDLEKAVTQQPVSIAIEADQSGFQFYSDGVFTGTCGTQLDHGVLAVGYGTLDGTDYWKVKNSWGATWGKEGYILLQRGKSQSGGQCGILMQPSYPVV